MIKLPCETVFIVQTAAAAMPSSCRGQYRRVAVLEVHPAHRHGVAMISERAVGCHRVVATWERQNVGKTDRCAYRQALAAANELATELNARSFAEQAVIDALAAKYDAAA